VLVLVRRVVIPFAVLRRLVSGAYSQQVLVVLGTSDCIGPAASALRRVRHSDVTRPTATSVGNLTGPSWRIFSGAPKRPDEGMLPIRASRGALEEKRQLKRSSASNDWGQLHPSPASKLLGYHLRG
jgi:hypothetical protein